MRILSSLRQLCKNSFARLSAPWRLRIPHVLAVVVAGLGAASPPVLGAAPEPYLFTTFSTGVAGRALFSDLKGVVLDNDGNILV